MRYLTPIQQRVLAEITWNCRCSIQDVAKKLKLKSHTVRYAIEQLHSNHNITPFCFTNPFSMGLTPFRVYFSADTSNRKKTELMMKHIRSLPEMGWFYRLHGVYQFGLSLRVRNIPALNKILVQFDENFRDIIFKKQIATIARFAHYEPALSHVGPGQRRVVEYTSDDNTVPLTPTDLKILSLIKAKPAAPVTELARLSGLPSSTVTYRLDRLVKNRVILGFAYFSNSFSGIKALVQIASKGLGGHDVERLFDFAGSCAKVRWAAKTLGEWDVEMEVWVDRVVELEEFVHQVYHFGEGHVREVITHIWGSDFF